MYASNTEIPLYKGLQCDFDKQVITSSRGTMQHSLFTLMVKIQMNVPFKVVSHKDPYLGPYFLLYLLMNKNKNKNNFISE